MRKAPGIIPLAAMLLAPSACGGEKGQDVELTVFAASMTEALTEIKAAHEEDRPGVLMGSDAPDDLRRALAQLEEGRA